MKATFFERLASYIVDIIIVNIIFNIICLGVGDVSSATKTKLNNLEEELVSDTIDTNEYLEEYSALIYDYQKESVVLSLVSVSVMFCYFVIFQYLNKGRTLGKMLFHLRVVDKNDDNPSILKYILRSIILFGVFSGVMSIILLYILNRNTYYLGYSIIAFTEGVFDLISVVFILYRKDGRGLHDIMGATRVIKEKRNA